MTKNTFCLPLVKGYEEVARDLSEDDMEFHLRHYMTMDDWQWADPMYRHWRRLVMIEALKRGLIAKDPGHGIPERS